MKCLEASCTFVGLWFVRAKRRGGLSVSFPYSSGSPCPRNAALRPYTDIWRGVAQSLSTVGVGAGCFPGQFRLAITVR